MIKATGIKMEGQPYMTRIEDDKERSIVINSSRMVSDYLSPSQLIQAGLAGCMEMTVKGEMFRAGLPYKDVTVLVNMDAQEGHTTFTYQIIVDSDADPALVEACKRKASAGCYVKGILTSEIEMKELL